jgi:hypothetical protein
MKKLLMLGAAVVAALSIATPTATAASTVRCGKIWRVDAGAWARVTDVGHRHNCKLVRRVARNIYSDMSGGAVFRFGRHRFREANDHPSYTKYDLDGHAFRMRYLR